MADVKGDAQGLYHGLSACQCGREGFVGGGICVGDGLGERWPWVDRWYVEAMLTACGLAGDLCKIFVGVLSSIEVRKTGYSSPCFEPVLAIRRCRLLEKRQNGWLFEPFS